MLDVMFDDWFTVRRLTGQRDVHGKPAYKVIVEKDSSEQDTDVPIYYSCFIDRRRTVGRGVTESTKSVDVTMYYNPDATEPRLIEEDLIVLESTLETYRVSDIREQRSAVEGSEYAVVGLVRVKTPVIPNSTPRKET